jgi:hypothetical protein
MTPMALKRKIVWDDGEFVLSRETAADTGSPRLLLTSWAP